MTSSTIFARFGALFIPSVRPPSLGLFAALIYVLAAVALAIGLSLQTPWIGLQLQPVDGQVRVVESSQGPSAAVPKGATLMSVGSVGDGTGLDLQASDLIEEPDVLPSYAQMDAFLARQQQIAQLLAQPQVILRWQTADTGGETVVMPQARPLLVAQR